MITEPARVYPSGPPPEAILNRRPLWHLVILLLAAVALLRFLAFDVIGGTLTVLLLCMAVVMISDGMQELSRYALVFGIVCCICAIMDGVALVAGIAGHAKVHIKPLSYTVHDGVKHYTYEERKTYSPFLDRHGGLVNNLKDITMIISPAVLLLASYLGFHAHWSSEIALLPLLYPQSHGQHEAHAIVHAPGGPSTSDESVAGGRQSYDSIGNAAYFMRFSGSPRRLDQT
mmetsp:Transcript_85170/g.237729  ORF Transcript_85170/g.237729 Transcript_85170/m.237729 type:complete len:230 (-) Transcript_85170:58-747(-)